MFPSGYRFTQDHEWAIKKNEVATVGISSYAAEELGEVVFTELPSVGSKFAKADEFGTIESVKTVSSLYMPLSGEVIEINENVIKNPALINDSPYNEGWLVKLKVADDSEYDTLLSSDHYKEYLENL